MTEPDAREEAINRWLDGEGPEGDLAHDPIAAAWQADHAALGDALAPVDDDTPWRERILSALADEPLPTAPPAARRLSLAWLAVPLAAAAGFLVAWVVRAPQPTATPQLVVVRGAPLPGPSRPPLGRLAVSTGAVELWSPDTRAWEPARPGTPLLAGAKLRTPPGRKASVRLVDGSELRLNERSTVACDGPRRLTLEAGQLWSHVARRGAADAFRIATRHGDVEVLGTELDVAVQPTRTQLTVFTGKARLTPKAGAPLTVEAGEQAAAGAGRRWEPSRLLRLESVSSWTAELLYVRGRDDPELRAKVNRLLAEVGHTKLTHLREQEIRSLGHTCSQPLAQYLLASRARALSDDTLRERRRTAARVLADVADAASLPALLAGLFDPDPEVRLACGRGWQRLTGRGDARGLAAWRDGSPRQRIERYRVLRARAQDVPGVRIPAVESLELPPDPRHKKAMK